MSTHDHKHPHHPPPPNPLWRRVVLACLVPLGWMILGAVCYLYKTDLSKMAGMVLFLIGAVSLIYNLLRVNKGHKDKKGLHL